MDQMAAEAGADNSGGPMWGRFFESIGGHDEDGSLVSGSHAHTDLHPPPYPESPLRNITSPEVGPNDSASVMDDDAASGVSFPALRRGVSSVGGISAGAAPPVDDGTYVFKFATPSKRTHRFQARYDDVEHLREIIIGKLETDPYFAVTEGEDAANVPKASDFQMYYKDADGDDVYISQGEDMSDAVQNARRVGIDRVQLFLHGGSSWKSTISAPAPAPPVQEIPASTPAPQPASEAHAHAAPVVDITEDAQRPTKIPTIPANDDILGIPRDLLLPASIGALAVVIIAVFTVSRFSD